jgi:hypothetical protein
MRRLACSTTARMYILVPVSVTVSMKSAASSASACARRNCAQVVAALEWRLTSSDVLTGRYNVQRRRVDLHQLTRRRHRHLPERLVRPVGQRPPGRCRPRHVFARRELVEQPIERALRGHRHRITAGSQQLLGAPQHEPSRARGGVRGLSDRHAHRFDYRPVHPAEPRRAARHPLVNQPEQPLFLIAQPMSADRAERHRDTGRVQLGNLRPLPAGQRPLCRVILRPQLAALSSSRRRPCSTSRTCCSHQRACSTAAAGTPSNVPVAGTANGAPAPITVKPGDACSTASGTVLTVPSTSASRTAGPATPTTVNSVPSTRTRSPGPSRPHPVTANPNRLANADQAARVQQLARQVDPQHLPPQQVEQRRQYRQPVTYLRRRLEQRPLLLTYRRPRHRRARPALPRRHPPTPHRRSDQIPGQPWQLRPAPRMDSQRPATTRSRPPSAPPAAPGHRRRNTTPRSLFKIRLAQTCYTESRRPGYAGPRARATAYGHARANTAKATRRRRTRPSRTPGRDDRRRQSSRSGLPAIAAAPLRDLPPEPSVSPR